MIAEKAADLIRARPPLSPAEVDGASWTIRPAWGDVDNSSASLASRSSLISGCEAARLASLVKPGG